MATHSSVLAWRIPGTGEPGGLPSMGSHRVGYELFNFEMLSLKKLDLCLLFTYYFFDEFIRSRGGGEGQCSVMSKSRC